ncbi:gametolysin peptidase M11 [Haematococcus lacustris]|uniref:Gametolysin peptidase M11 n=1 Tax=Haematococcus lacustris TaxID=44745 RepID=A0A6A0A1Q0_HAELA|nr:gametolysin peptidase M11 [Haematococcus lacustris]
MCPQSGMRWTLVLVTAVLTHSFATAMTERPGTLIGTLLSLEVHGGQPSFYLRSDNYTIFHLVMAQGVSSLPDGYELRGPSPRASVSYYAVEGRRLFLNAPITLLPQPSAPLQETLTLPRAMLRQSQAPPASQAAALAAGPATGTEDVRRQLQTVLPRPNTFLGALPVIVYLASMCTPRGVQPAAASVQDVRSMLFGPGGLNDLYGQCSGQQANLDPINTVVMQVNIPCSGTKLDGSGPWDTTTCGCAAPASHTMPSVRAPLRLRLPEGTAEGGSEVHGIYVATEQPRANHELCWKHTTAGKPPYYRAHCVHLIVLQSIFQTSPVQAHGQVELGADG